MKRNLAIYLSKVGEARAAAKDFNGALAAFDEGVTIRQKLAETDANNIPMQAEVATAQERIGDLKRVPATGPARSPPMWPAWTPAGRSAMPC